MRERTSAVSYDLDGVIFQRVPFQFAAFLPSWMRKSILKPKHAPITIDERETQFRRLSIAEKVELEFHNIRHVKPEATKMVNQTQADLKIGNTGRPNHEQMVRVTKRHLFESDIGHEFANVAFKPKGVSSDESKYWTLIELQRTGYTDIVHYDDNALTVKRLAKLLPQVRFIIVQDLTSGILFSKSEMKKYPNVARIALHKNGEIETTFMPEGFGELPHLRK
ncbi:MAG: hypothetical protein Q7R51_00895 [bacterium]|nr:hypothetical protein [bacterium]